MPEFRKTCRRWNDFGHAHSLTFSCFQRRPFLTKDRTRTWMIDAIERARSEHELHVWAYVIMPEHVHLLIWPTRPDYSISAILKTIKLSVTRRALTFVREQHLDSLIQMTERQPNGKLTYRFWQRGGGYDRNLIEPKAIWANMDYIHANPVRRGLCRIARDWPWSSALTWEDATAGSLRIDRESVPKTVLG